MRVKPARKATNFICEVSHPAGRGSKHTTVEGISPPTIRLEEFGQSVMCVIEDFYPKTLSIKWKEDDREVGGRDWKTTENDSGFYGAVSVFEANLTSASPGTKYTCEVTHGGRTYTENLSTRAQFSLKINPPPAKELFINQRAVLECVLTGDSRKEVEGATVSWTAGGRSPATGDVRVGGVTQAGSAFTKTSTLTLEESVWFSGTEVICSTSRTSEKISVKRGGQRPSIIIYKPDKPVSDSDSVSLVCEVSSSDLANVYVMWKVNGGQYIEGNRMTTIKNDNTLIVLSYLTVTGQQYNSAEIVCAAKDANVQNDLQPRTSSPSKTKSPPKIHLVESGQSIMCIIEDFYPKALKIKWKKDDHEVRGRDWKTTENNLGSYRAVSVLEANLTSSSPGTKYTCEVTHGGTAYSENLLSRAQFSLKINPPPAKELFINQRAVLECVITGDSKKQVEGATVSWTAGGRSPATRDVRVGGVTQAGSAFTKTSTLTLEESVWFSGSEVICSTSRDKTAPEKISVKRGGQRPSIVIYKPDKPVSDSDSVSLVCEVSSSDLANVYVMWKVNGGQYIEGNRMTTIKNDNTLIVLSYLTVTGQQYNSAEIVCAVKDANMQNDVQPRTSSPSKKNSPPTIRLMEFGESIMCIIEDFYPKPLSIKWKKDDREVQGRDWKTTENDSGSYRKVSVLEANRTSSKAGTKYTCEVTHDGRKNSENLISKAHFSLKINPPQAKELFIIQKAIIKCVITGDIKKEVEGATVSWTVGSKTQPSGAVHNLFNETGQFFSKTSTLTLEESNWFSGEEVMCSTSRDEIEISEKIRVKKGGKRPSVIIYKPDKTVNDTDMVSLVCEVSSSDLTDLYVMWEVKSGQFTEGNSTTTIKKDNTLIVLSYLTVTGKQYNSEEIACNVKDANMEMINTPIIHTTSMSKVNCPVCPVLECR
uniref:Ig-like domain-containing protein n=1 Tax=Pygocentrus nattereri TaxID=42514 RepID=A0A3B4D6Q2_PYGNA